MTIYSESSIITATIGLVGVLGSAVILTYAFVANRRESIKAKRIRNTDIVDQELFG